MGKSLKGRELGRGFHQRKDGRYEARIQINGKSIDLINPSLTVLKKQFEEEKKLLLNNMDIDAITGSSSLSEWFDIWFPKYKAPQLKNETSKKAIMRKCKNTYVEILGDKPLNKITQNDIQEATYDIFKKNISDKYIREGYGILKTCMDIAVINHYIPTNPCMMIIFPDRNLPSQTQEIDIPDKWEQKLFLQTCSGTYYDELYQIMMSSGMRIGEVGGLQWDDVDYNNQFIRIRRSLATDYVNGQKIQKLTTPKTAQAYREIPFFGETATLFKKWKEKQDKRRLVMGDRWRGEPEFGNLVFTTIYGSPINKYVIQNDMNKIEKNMILTEKFQSDEEHRIPRNIIHLHPHLLRHIFISTLVEKKMDTIMIQRIAGHANLSTTMRYVHLLRSQKRKEADKIGNFFS